MHRKNDITALEGMVAKILILIKVIFEVKRKRNLASVSILQL